MNAPTQTTPARAVVLLSGGLDSATCLAIARSEGFECHCLTIAYGQRHAEEIEAARALADGLGAASHRCMSVDLRAFGGSALTDEIDVPKSDVPFTTTDEGIPVTYVPARNTIFLSYALALAEVLDARAIHIGVNAVDYSGYPDCRPAFVNAFQGLADVATRAGVEGHGPRIETPLLLLTKVDIIRRGLALGVDYGMTHSCYDPGEAGCPCLHCDACRIRLAAFESLGAHDPLLDRYDLPRSP